jgi:hypothetical protein
MSAVLHGWVDTLRRAGPLAEIGADDVGVKKSRREVARPEIEQRAALGGRTHGAAHATVVNVSAAD